MLPHHASHALRLLTLPALRLTQRHQIMNRLTHNLMALINIRPRRQRLNQLHLVISLLIFQLAIPRSLLAHVVSKGTTEA
jgi:hypothetical protein